MECKDKLIEISKPKIINSKLVCTIAPSKKIKEYFKEKKFYADYNLDISKVDPSILQIPALSTIIPTAWATGADIYVETLDKVYLESLEKIRKIMKTWYPKLSFNTKIHVDNVVSNSFRNNKNVGLLFSGGVDSLYSYFKHKNEKPILIMIWGVDIPIKQETFWKKVQKTYIQFAKNEKATIRFIKTNTRECINEAALTRDYSRYLTSFSWWGGFSHGLTTIGPCAPLTVVDKIDTLLITSNVDIRYKFPWGSRPITDEKTSWSKVKIISDGYPLIRHEKIQYLTKILKKKKFPIRVCYTRFEKLNCSKCDKCLSTITNLIIQGVDPKRAGFNIDEDILHRVKNFIVSFNREKILKKYAIWWRDIKNNTSNELNHNLYNVKNFIKWFKTYEIKEPNTKLDPILITLYFKLYCMLPEKNRNLLSILKKISLL